VDPMALHKNGKLSITVTASPARCDAGTLTSRVILGIRTCAINLNRPLRPTLIPITSVRRAERFLDRVLSHCLFSCCDHGSLCALLGHNLLITRDSVFLTRSACARRVHVLGLKRRRSAIFGIDTIGDNAGSWSAHIGAVIGRHNPARATSISCSIRDQVRIS
jgi:hypothetical protein